MIHSCMRMYAHMNDSFMYAKMRMREMIGNDESLKQEVSLVGKAVILHITDREFESPTSYPHIHSLYIHANECYVSRYIAFIAWISMNVEKMYEASMSKLVSEWILGFHYLRVQVSLLVFPSINYWGNVEGLSHSHSCRNSNACTCMCAVIAFMTWARDKNNSKTSLV